MLRDDVVEAVRKGRFPMVGDGKQRREWLKKEHRLGTNYAAWIADPSFVHHATSPSASPCATCRTMPGTRTLERPAATTTPATAWTATPPTPSPPTSPDCGDPPFAGGAASGERSGRGDPRAGRDPVDRRRLDDVSNLLAGTASTNPLLFAIATWLVLAWA